MLTVPSSCTSTTRSAAPTMRSSRCSDSSDGQAEVVDQPRQGREDLLGAGRVEGRGGLVEDEQPGVGGEHGADGDALLLAAGEVAQGGVTQVGDPEQVEHLLDPASHRGGVQGQLFEGVGELLLHGVGDEARQRVLPHHAHHAGEVARAVGAGVVAEDRDPTGQVAAGEVRDRAVDGAEQRRLPRPGAAGDDTSSPSSSTNDAERIAGLGCRHTGW